MAATLAHLLTFRSLAAIIAVITLCGGLPAIDDPTKSNEEDAQREEQAKKVQRSAAQYTISPVGEGKKPFKFHEKPLMKWGNPVGGAKDGAVYVWSDGHRPQAILKLFSHDGEFFTHEWQSLAEGEIVALRGERVIWNPSKPGITFQEIPDAPKPGENAETRLRQMKSLAGKFKATSTRFARDATPTELRLLIQPMFRFDPGEKMDQPDGALFGFAEGTDPSGLLTFEVRRTKDGDRWHYAFVRLSTFAVSARYGGKEIYSADKYDFSRDPNDTFLPLPGLRAPKQ